MNKTVIYRYYVYMPTNGKVLDYNNTFTKKSEFIKLFNTQKGVQNAIDRLKNKSDYKNKHLVVKTAIINF